MIGVILGAVLLGVFLIFLVRNGKAIGSTTKLALIVFFLLLLTGWCWLYLVYIAATAPE